MKRIWLMVLCTLAASAVHAQTFPFVEEFTSYGPGSTGAPAWSSIPGSHWTVENGALAGPTLCRFNLRPPKRYTVDAAFRLKAIAEGTAKQWECGFNVNMQRELLSCPADGICLRVSGTGSTLSVAANGLCSDRTPEKAPRSIALNAKPDDIVHLRAAVDSESGRIAVWVNDALAARSVPAEYAGGLLAVRAGECVDVSRVEIRAPNEEETRALLVTSLFNDPRDIADGRDGTVLVLHRGSPAVLSVTSDGEVKRSFGRRMPGALTDPVAMAVGKSGEVMVLNRFPGEVIAYGQSGGIRRRFGKGTLKQPVDIAVAPSGAVYIADAEAHAIQVFSADGQFRGTYALDAMVPTHVGVDAGGSLLVSMATGVTQALRPASRPEELAMVREWPGIIDRAVSRNTQTWACGNGTVWKWQAAPAGEGFRATSVGGLGTKQRLAIVNDTVYVLDSDHGRIVGVPMTLKEPVPEVTFQNIAGSAALVRWESPNEAASSHVRILMGSTWQEITQKNTVATTHHQVGLKSLSPGTSYRYCVSPVEPTIPPADWSVEYTFETPSAGVKS